MFPVLSLFRSICAQLACRFAASNKSAMETPISGSIYLERRKPNGSVAIVYMDCCKLIREEDRLYLFGWLECMPHLDVVPVDAIEQLVDNESGELVTQDKVVCWLKKRSFH
jgi:hypothetical protein